MLFFRIFKQLLWAGVLAFLGILLIVFCSSSDEFSITLADSAEPAGNFRIMWPQTDDNGELIASGTYSVRMSALDFHDSREIRISSNFSSVPTSDDTMTCKGGSMLPSAFQLSLNSTTYAPGDTVLMCCTLPTASNLKVMVVRE